MKTLIKSTYYFLFIMMKRLNFSWVLPNLLAASSILTSKEELDWLAHRQGITLIITLTEDSLIKNIKNFNILRKELQIKYYHIPTTDGTEFSMHQFEKMVKIFNEAINNNDKLLIHCKGGFGLTSTALTAIWMSRFKVRFEEAMKELKKDERRPQLMYTLLQIDSLKEWETKMFN